MMKKLFALLLAAVMLLGAGATALAAEQRGFYLRSRESSYKRYPLAGIDFAALAVAVALIVCGALL